MDSKILLSRKIAFFAPFAYPAGNGEQPVFRAGYAIFLRRKVWPKNDKWQPIPRGTRA